ncbi:response regulator [Paenibacillus pasadenensis]|uniref:response regulator n=1 Tax=Paenibacillus pasadenensis TaxID=217090 RepID=UPI00204033C3|nr:response regulator [Paenibacillus pasadenensis]MCM3747110.1 response regulator [Paenibacillus pasadenensis]
MSTKVLIVDDEILVRISLKTLIPWEEAGFEIIGEATDGLEALELLEKQSCQIVLTDIRMPNMGGLGLIQQIRSKWPSVKCVILSNHNDFEYVQQALRLGAVDFILKLAWTPEELLDKCRGIREALLEEQLENEKQSVRLERLSRQSTELLLRNLLGKQASKPEIDTQIRDHPLPQFLKEGYRVAAVSIDQRERVLEQNRFKSEQLLLYTVANIINELLRKYGSSELVDMHSGRLLIIRSSISDELLHEIRSAVIRFAQVSISFGVSCSHQGEYELHQSFIEAEAALARRFFLRGEFVFYPGSDKNSSLSLLPVDNWIRRIEAGELEPLKQEFAEWQETLKGQTALGSSLVREQWLQLLHGLGRTPDGSGKDIHLLQDAEGRFPFDVIRNAETLQEIADWFFGWLPGAVSLIRRPSRPIYREEVQAVIEMMQREYATPIKVSDLARRVGFSENYLSVLFKKETGEKIVDFLTKIRMQKARELLMNPSLKIYEISERVGYTDSNHFSKYFKKMEGLFPLEYRRLATGRGEAPSEASPSQHESAVRPLDERSGAK